MLSLFKNLKIAHRISGLVVIAALMAGSGASISAFLQARTAIKESIENKLASLVVARRDMLRLYVSAIDENVRVLGANADIGHAIQEFTAALQSSSDADASQTADAKTDMFEYVRNLYITKNKYPVGEKNKLDNAGDGSVYSTLHAKYHPWLRKFIDTRGYYDLFLINKQGDVVYTDFKENDFGSNLINGPWKDSGIAYVFREALKKNPGETVFADFAPYAPSNGIPAAFVGVPVYSNGQVMGVLAFQLPIDKLNAITQTKDGLGKTGETYLVGQDFLMRSDSRFSKESTILKTKVETDGVKAGLKGETGIQIVKDYRGEKVFSSYTPLALGTHKLVVIAEQDVSEAYQPIYDLLKYVIIIVSVITAIVAGAGLIFAGRISTPINKLVGQMRLLESGDKKFEVAYRDRRDEIGNIATALQSFKETAIRNDQMEAEQRNEQEKKEERQRKVGILINSFDLSATQTVSTVASASTQLSQTAEHMSKLANNTNHQSVEVASASELASHNVQSVASAAEQMAATVQEISKQISMSNNIVCDAMSKAEIANKSSQELVEMSKSVGDIANLIENIAGQINLLALNATIESARSGEAGKGFAVVANEVKNLATQTAKATEQIRQQLQAVQTTASGVAGSLSQVREAIAKVSESSAAIASAVEEQSAATQEIVSNMGTATQGVEQINSGITSIRGGTESTTTATREVLEAARLLSMQAEKMDQEVKNFLSEIQAA